MNLSFLLTKAQVENEMTQACRYVRLHQTHFGQTPFQDSGVWQWKPWSAHYQLTNTQRTTTKSILCNPFG